MFNCYLESMAIERRGTKSERTRLRIIDEAFALFERNGYDDSTVEKIAAAAGITSRTFFRYFAGKEDLILLGQAAENRRVAKALKARPNGMSDLDFLLSAMPPVLDWSSQKVFRVKRSLRLIDSTPALRNSHLGTLADLEDVMCHALTAPRAPKSEALRVRLLVSAYLALVRTVMNAHARADTRATPDELMAEVERRLRRGFTA